MKIRFVGDIHAGYEDYLSIIANAEYSIQVGDFGIGFRKNPIELYDTAKHRFIRGNHDWPAGCKAEPNYIPDGTVENSMMFMGGAFSIDREWRTEGRDFWGDEEMSLDELYRMYDKYVMEKPRLVVAHEFPEYITNYFPLNKWNLPSRTRDAFQAMFEKHRPEIWIGGHWHINFDKKIDDCRFIVLDCHSWIDIDVANMQIDEHQTSFKRMKM